MSQALRLEPAVLVDAQQIARMSRALVEHGLVWRWSPRAVAAMIRDPDTEVVVARRGRGVAGFAIMRFDFERRTAHLALMAVARDLRRRGVGRALFGWLATLARRGGIASFSLEVRAGNAGGRAFYRSLGFREEARLPGYYDRREDAVRMRARIAGRAPVSDP